jgi:cyclin-dependent kinase 7
MPVGRGPGRRPSGSERPRPRLRMADEGKIWKDYKKIVKVGEGAFGDVYKAKHRKSGHVVAVKKIRIMKNRREAGFDVSAIDEIRMLQGLDHENVVTLHEILAGHGEIALVLDFLQTDLEHIIKDRDPSKDPNSFDSFIVQITPEDIKAYMRMLFLGLEACHSRFIMHRDLKPGNLLLSDSGVLKLGDFGLARTFGSPNARFSPEAITRWYRPLELLLGGDQYGPACDMWSVSNPPPQCEL